jgi:methionine-rich copper-binding protein CopC
LFLLRSISASPAVGVEVDSWPDQLTLEFEEVLINLDGEKTNFVVVNNAVGDQISEPDEVISGNSISVTLSPNEVKGPILVYYRVVSADGHPIEGEYKFTYGIGEVTAQGVEPEDEGGDFPIGIYITSAIFIISGLFFGIYSYRRRSAS